MARTFEQQKALTLWFEALARSVRGDQPDLSARQLAIVLTIYLTDGPHTVRGLTSGLRISKPAVTRALDRLADLEFIERVRDPGDRRSVFIERTEPGEQFVVRLADEIVAAKRTVELG
ncbi:MAG: MarR family transcriptional regulator [Rhodospirillaceae bacterium]|nr:MarR family transcriptional regulator [Rhodospirillaceae bacterium]